MPCIVISVVKDPATVHRRRYYNISIDRLEPNKNIPFYLLEINNTWYGVWDIHLYDVSFYSMETLFFSQTNSLGEMFSYEGTLLYEFDSVLVKVLRY